MNFVELYADYGEAKGLHGVSLVLRQQKKLLPDEPRTVATRPVAHCAVLERVDGGQNITGQRTVGCIDRVLTWTNVCFPLRLQIKQICKRAMFGCLPQTSVNNSNP